LDPLHPFTDIAHLRQQVLFLRLDPLNCGTSVVVTNRCATAPMSKVAVPIPISITTTATILPSVV
jgi:hypothetical protein